MLQVDGTQRFSATEAALASGFIPGVGQLLQGRYLAAAVHFSTVATYLVVGAEFGLRRALFAALAWNVYSIIDAYRHRLD
jgi:hypothetical protein